MKFTLTFWNLLGIDFPNICIVRDLNKGFTELKISISGSLPVKFGNKIFPKKIFIGSKDAASNFRGTSLKNFSAWSSLREHKQHFRAFWLDNATSYRDC